MTNYYLLKFSIYDGGTNLISVAAMDETNFNAWKKESLLREDKAYEIRKNEYDKAWKPFLQHKEKVKALNLHKLHPREYPEEYKELRNWPTTPDKTCPKNTKVVNYPYTNTSNFFERPPFSSMKINEELIAKGIVTVQTISKSVYDIVKAYKLEAHYTTLLSKKSLFSYEIQTSYSR